MRYPAAVLGKSRALVSRGACALAIATLTVGCGHSRAVGTPHTKPANKPGYETVARVDPVTRELTSPDPTASAGEGPNWLRRLAEHDILTYVVQRGQEGDGATVELLVQRLVRRGSGVAALLVPHDDVGEVQCQPHWLVGDEGGLYRLEGLVDLKEPGFVPLDQAGQLLGPSRGGVRWQLPAGWPKQPPAPDRQGWQIEELELVLEGPISGQRCARIRRDDEGASTRITVCADLGMVETVRGDLERPEERWSLSRIRRAPPAE